MCRLEKIKESTVYKLRYIQYIVLWVHTVPAIWTWEQEFVKRHTCSHTRPNIKIEPLQEQLHFRSSWIGNKRLVLICGSPIFPFAHGHTRLVKTAKIGSWFLKVYRYPQKLVAACQKNPNDLAIGNVKLIHYRRPAHPVISPLTAVLLSMVGTGCKEWWSLL